MVATTTSLDGFSRDHALKARQDELLLVFHDDQGARVEQLSDGETLIVGRESPATVVLEDRSLSRQHASFRRRKNAVMVEDLESRNGTYVHGDRVRNAWLEPGDEVFLARVLVTIHVRGRGEGERGANGHEVYQALGKAYDDTQVGFVVVDRDGQSVWNNQRFAQLVCRNDGICMAGARVHFNDNQAQRALDQALGQLGRADESAGNGESNELSCVQRTSSPRPYVLGFFGIGPSPTHQINGPSASHLCLTVIDPDRSVEVSTDLLRQVYGITPAEARVANALACGLRVQDIAERNGVSATTVRNQLKSLFFKTQTTSQSDLVRVILLTASAQRRPE